MLYTFWSTTARKSGFVERGWKMFKNSEIFEEHYADYIRQISDIDLTNLTEVLAIESTGDQVTVPFFGENHTVSKEGIFDGSGKRPHYVVCVILAKYVLSAPDLPHDDTTWVSFKDFKQTSHFLNVNYFSNDTEKAIVKTFAGKKELLSQASENLGGHHQGGQFQYDVSMVFRALPRISLLMLFNDQDDEFPAQCRVLFQKHSEFYLDPESLAMTGAYLSKRLQGVKL